VNDLSDVRRKSASQERVSDYPGIRTRRAHPRLRLLSRDALLQPGLSSCSLG